MIVEPRSAELRPLINGFFLLLPPPLTEEAEERRR
jgi:hypothetical protein